MGIRTMTRRGAIAIGLGGALASLTGCGKKDLPNAVSEGLIAIGGLVLTIPHWLGKVIGAALVSGGSALKVYFACADGSEKAVEIALTAEQKQKIEEAVAGGQKFTVTDPEGKKQTVARKK
jgi:hypothetical protein